MAGKKPQGRIQEASQSVGSIATINKEPLIGFMKGSRKWRLPTLTKEFYVCSAVRAEQTRAAHLLHRTSPGHSRCASIASPAQRGSTHRFPRYCTASWRVVQSHYIWKESLSKLRLSSKWRLPTLPQRSAVPSAMLSLTTLFGMGRGGTSAL